MKRSSTLFLKGVIVLIGLVVLGLLGVLFPIGIKTDVTGWYRPILIGMYLPAIPFYFALYEAMNILKYIDKNKAFSNLSVTSLKNIKFCAFVISALFTAGMPYIFWAADKDDAPGVVAFAFIIIFASFIIAVAAAVFERLFQNAVDLKNENDLTV